MNFDKWWPCLKKHTKRVKYLLPYAKQLKANLNSERPFKTLHSMRPCDDRCLHAYKGGCSRLRRVPPRDRRVVFCEYNQEHVPMMRELIGVETAGFREGWRTSSCSRTTILRQRFQIYERSRIIESKRASPLRRSRATCCRKRLITWNAGVSLSTSSIWISAITIIQTPPDIMKVNKTVDRMLEWQRRVHAASTSTTDSPEG